MYIYIYIYRERERYTDLSIYIGKARAVPYVHLAPAGLDRRRSHHRLRLCGFLYWLSAHGMTIGRRRDLNVSLHCGQPLGMKGPRGLVKGEQMSQHGRGVPLGRQGGSHPVLRLFSKTCVSSYGMLFVVWMRDYVMAICFMFVKNSSNGISFENITSENRSQFEKAATCFSTGRLLEISSRFMKPWARAPRQLSPSLPFLRLPFPARRRSRSMEWSVSDYLGRIRAAQLRIPGRIILVIPFHPWEVSLLQDKDLLGPNLAIIALQIERVPSPPAPAARLLRSYLLSLMRLVLRAWRNPESRGGDDRGPRSKGSPE